VDDCAPRGAPVVDLRWRLALGGIGWTLRALQWVLEEGIHVVPEARTWIDELVARAAAVTGNLRPAART
jgi:hypothetical protein